MAEEFVSIKSITITNFKSIIETTIQLGGFNVFIGANGCGKSNILEAIALGAAASANKLDYEYFANRGIRTTKLDYMLPQFDKSRKQSILISIIDSFDKSSVFRFHYSNSLHTHWKVDRKSDFNNEINKNGNQLVSHPTVRGNPYYKRFNLSIVENEKHFSILAMPITNLNEFLIFSLEETKLREADMTNRTYPLGIHGEGLFAYLKEISKRENSVIFFNELKENLIVFDWFDDIEVPEGQLSNEYNIILKDYYLDETLNTFDQRNTNEGFLYLLFYLTLIISDETPKFFAIENIDSSFNPKLCREVIRRLIALAKKHGKQIIATTHNPSVLDGLDLDDDDVRLYTIRRTIDGDTKASRVTLKNELTIPLSEAWQRGYIGGLPDNF